MKILHSRTIYYTNNQEETLSQEKNLENVKRIMSKWKDYSTFIKKHRMENS